MAEFMKRYIVVIHLVIFVFLSGVASIAIPSKMVEATVIIDALMAYFIYRSIYRGQEYLP